MPKTFKLWLIILLGGFGGLHAGYAQTVEYDQRKITSEFNYLIGRGVADITGPAFGIQMWGFSKKGQTTQGIHIRLKARAFIIIDPASSNRLVFVSADIGSIEHNIVLEVVDRLRVRYKNLYTLDNVILSATHTHSGPDGYWHQRNETGFGTPFFQEYFEYLVSGLTDAIVMAHEDIQPANILINHGDVPASGKNRSLIAYEQNPSEERALYSGPIDKDMTLLSFVGDAGALGLINWHSVHPTSMTYDNRLISGDHKGYAALVFEKMTGDQKFVAAFAQATPGDITANLNLDNTGPGRDMVESTKIIGQRQMNVAKDLFENAQEKISGAIETRRLYFDMSNFKVEDRFTKSGPQTTCPSAYGYAFAAGSAEDGGGHRLFREGMTKRRRWIDFLIRRQFKVEKPTKYLRQCHGVKPILFAAGLGDPPTQSQIRSVTLARIGQLVILAIPAEATTMSARRLRETVRAELGDNAKHIIIAGYSNGFAGYLTTPEEYGIQQYEGGHTLHGRWSLPAYQQVVSALAHALASGKPITHNVVYDDWRGKSHTTDLTNGKADNLVDGARFGDALPLSKLIYAKGEIVVAEFWSGNPSANLAADRNHLLVERKQGGVWTPVADDGDWSTIISWHFVGRRRSHVLRARVAWQTEIDQAPGEYRIKHLGQYTDQNNRQHLFEAVGQVFKVK